MTELRFSSAPEQESIYSVGDDVEVFCDHDRNGERVRDWLRGVVVQADPKMVAIQFTDNVYLTDGWMVPDHVLWSTQKSANLRPYKANRRRRPRVL